MLIFSKEYNHLAISIWPYPNINLNINVNVAWSHGVINCVASNGSTRCNKNAGGWPVLSQNRRALTLPSNYNSTASNGYTNLENWLHSLDLQVQGLTSSSSPTAAPSLSAQ